MFVIGNCVEGNCIKFVKLNTNVLPLILLWLNDKVPLNVE